MYYLWVDDESYEPHKHNHHPPIADDIYVATSVQEAIDIINRVGAPYYIDLDDDLNDGKRESVKEIVKYLFNNHPDTHIDYRVRSPNSFVGDWLYTFMFSWHQIKGFNVESCYDE